MARRREIGDDMVRVLRGLSVPVTEEQAVLETRFWLLLQPVLHNMIPPSSDGIVLVSRLTLSMSLTAVPHVGGILSDTRLASFLSSNLVIHVSGRNCVVTVGFPQSRTAPLLDRILITVRGHHLQILNVTIITGENTISVYCMQCLADPNAELVWHDLNTELHFVICDFLGHSDSVSVTREEDHA